MGGGVSVPERLDKATARALAGDQFDAAEFDAASNEGFMSRDTFLKAANDERKESQQDSFIKANVANGSCGSSAGAGDTRR